jgi:hypothetical protein
LAFGNLTNDVAGMRFHPYFYFLARTPDAFPWPKANTLVGECRRSFGTKSEHTNPTAPRQFMIHHVISSELLAVAHNRSDAS